MDSIGSKIFKEMGVMQLIYPDIVEIATHFHLVEINRLLAGGYKLLDIRTETRIGNMPGLVGDGTAYVKTVSVFILGRTIEIPSLTDHPNKTPTQTH